MKLTTKELRQLLADCPPGPWQFNRDDWSARPGDAVLCTNHGPDGNVAAGRSFDEDVVLLEVESWGDDLGEGEMAAIRRLAECLPALAKVAVAAINLLDIETHVGPDTPASAQLLALAQAVDALVSRSGPSHAEVAW